MAFCLSKLSRDRLQGVHPDLVRVVERAIQRRLTTSGFRKACPRLSARPSWSRAAFLEGPHFELSRVEYPA